ncbi:MAG: hypothetical protein H6945_13500 [Zoogloeaceae bacterium]|nr:hypothetical protein [Rhodocyclaceae bacterium]MCP5236742.1 hypothetical protein [Zoogloeaceae bacterium]
MAQTSINETEVPVRDAFSTKVAFAAEAIESLASRLYEKVSMECSPEVAAIEALAQKIGLLADIESGRNNETRVRETSDWGFDGVEYTDQPEPQPLR